MKSLLATVMLAAACVSAYAECNPGRADIVTLAGWEAVDLGDSAYSLKLELKNVSDKPIRMVEGGTYFSDLLGRSAGGWNLPPDLILAPGDTHTQQWSRIVSPGDGGRIAKLPHDEVSAKTCVTAVVYDDGTVENFD